MTAGAVVLTFLSVALTFFLCHPCAPFGYAQGRREDPVSLPFSSYSERKDPGCPIGVGHDSRGSRPYVSLRRPYAFLRRLYAFLRRPCVFLRRPCAFLRRPYAFLRHPYAFLRRPYVFLRQPCVFSLSSLRTLRLCSGQARGSRALSFSSYSEGKDPGSPIRVGDDKNASRRLRAGLRPGPVHSIWWRGLSERSEFRSPHTRDRGAGTPLGAPPGRDTPHLVLREQESSYSASLSRNPYSRLVRATMAPVALS